MAVVTIYPTRVIPVEVAIIVISAVSVVMMVIVISAVGIVTMVIVIEAARIITVEVAIVPVEPPPIVSVSDPGANAVPTAIMRIIMPPPPLVMLVLALGVQLVMKFADSGARIPVIGFAGGLHPMEDLANAATLSGDAGRRRRPLVVGDPVIPLDCGCRGSSGGRVRRRYRGRMPAIGVVGSLALSPRGRHQQQATQRAVDDGASHDCPLLSC